MILTSTSLTRGRTRDVRLTSKGQLTIPAAIRDELGLHPGTEVRFEIDGDAVRVMRADAQTRGQRIVEHLRRHRGSGEYSTEQIMAWTRGWGEDDDHV
jgi:AbrB family looped-hinge helix DNA binding protein